MIKLKNSLLTNKNFTEDGYRKRFREVKPETEEMPDQFVQPERIGHLLTDSLRQIKETLGQFLTGLPRFLLK